MIKAFTLFNSLFYILFFSQTYIKVCSIMLFLPIKQLKNGFFNVFDLF
jgi:hypothetical protein